MSAPSTPSKPAPQRRWPKRLGLAAAVFVVLLVVAWFTVTSGAFIKGVVLPRVGSALNAKVTAEDVALSPFSSLSVSGLKVETAGTEPLVTLKDLRVRYSLMDIIGGKITVEEITVDSPVLQLVFNADGTSNLDPLLRSSSEPKKEASSSETPRLAVRNVQLKNALVRVVQKQADGSALTAEIAGLNVSLDQLVNGAKTSLKIAAALKAVQTGPNAFSLAARLDGDLGSELSAELMPKQATGKIQLGVAGATGSLAVAQGLRVELGTDLTPGELRDLSVNLSRNAEALAAVKLSGPFDLAQTTGQLDLAVSGVDRRLFAFVRELTGLDLGDSALALSAKITLAEAGQQIGVVGRLDGKALNVKSADGTATPATDLALTYDVTLKGDALTVREVSLAPSVLGRPGGRVVVDGAFRLADSTGSVAVRLEGLNQDLVNPFLGGELAGRELLSLALDGRTTVQLNHGGAVELKTDLGVSNLVTRAAGSAQADPALQLGLRTDLAHAGNVLTLRDLSVQLPPSALASNRLALAGRVDLSRPDATSGRLTLSSDALDLTPLYDFLAGGPANPGTPPPAPATTNAEPDALMLPVGEFTFATRIGRMHLRQIAVSNLVADARVTSNAVVLKPVSWTLNGAPVSADADLDLGVKGWRYDLNAKLDRVPAQPIVDSFLPGYEGQFLGSILVDTRIKGAGMTGVNLKKSLEGNVGFSLTNVNIHVVSPKWKPLLTLIGTALRLTDIAQSPLNAIYSDIQLGGGAIDLKGVTVESEAFRADIVGAVQIADVLNDSVLPELPVKLQLRRSLARRANLLPDGTPEDAKYAPIQDFVKLKGTLGAPEADIDKGVVALLVLKSSPVGDVTGAAGGILKGGANVVGGVLGGLFGGGGTNAPATDATPAPAGSTNAPAGSTNAAPKNPLEGLINPFRR
jgi:uncharacterized protein involved in outer membrane biogenesis